MSMVLRYGMGDAHQGPVSEMTYTVSSGTLNSSIPYRAVSGKVTVGLVECSGIRTTGFMASDAGGLTARDRKPLRNITLISNMGVRYLPM